MSKLRLTKPSPALVISCIALFVALSGSSYAVIVLPKNSVGTKQIRNNAVKSSKIAPDQVTGADVNEATLGQVPSAGSAQNAGNAGTLDGLDSSGFLRNGEAAGGRLAGTYPNPTIPANSLTGADIQESSLATVPFASSAGAANSAINANMLDNLDSSDFLRGEVYIRVFDTTCVASLCTEIFYCDSFDRLLTGGVDDIDTGTFLSATTPWVNIYSGNGQLLANSRSGWLTSWDNNSTADAMEVRLLCTR